jgi:putative cardiolipin synthase
MTSRNGVHAGPCAAVPAATIGTTIAATQRHATTTPRASHGVVRSLARITGLAAMLVVLASCATIDFDAVPRSPSSAWSQPGSTRLGRSVLADRRSSDRSAFALLDTGADALAARLALIDAAERTLDLQYYLVRGATSLVVADRLVAAADRGVRVRLLVDDTATFESERGLAALDGHANIEVRAFNPFHIREPRVLAHTVELLLRGAQLNRRMHNKAFVADSAYAIVGGRNLGDEYFGANDEVDFYDFDLLAAGAIVRDVAASFDRYWNSPFAIPIAALVPRLPQAEREQARAALAAARTRLDGGPVGRDIASSAIARRIRSGEPPTEWARARLLVDEPAKVEAKASDGDASDSEIATSLAIALARAKREIVIVTPYFVPGEDGVRTLRAARERGAAVRALTNSLATTDVPLAHAAGYSRYRVALLEAGVDLFELRPHALPAQSGRNGGGSGGSGSGGSGSRATLHGKAFVIDGTDLMIGSFNLDHRSAELNTEIVIAVRSATLAGQMRERFARATAARNSYRVTLAANGRGLRWTGAGDGATVVLEDEPETTPAQRLWSRAISLLPVERQL